MKVKASLISVMLIFILCGGLFGCGEELNHTEYGFALDTEIRVRVNERYAKEAKEAVELCRSYEKLFSGTDEESSVYRFNHYGEDLEPEAAALVKKAEEISAMSGGAFDPYIAPLTNLWDIKNRTVPPTEEEISAAMADTGRELDLGGIAKGYISQKAREYLIEKGVDRAILDLGGNIAVIGEDYKIGVQSPFETDKIIKTITLSDGFAVTSGGYRRYFEYEGKRYHHIISPFTGRPAESGLASVTITSKDGALADALSTAVYVLGEEKGLKLCEKEGVHGVLVRDSGEAVEF